MSHNHSHSHGHSHSHSHSHPPNNYNKAFAVGIALNVIFIIVEVVFGTMANSLALLADAGHNLSDVVSLFLAWGASLLSAKEPTEKKTYGFRRATILASLASAILLILALGGIAWEALHRISTPSPIQGKLIMLVAGVGVIINTATALLFISGQKDDLNIKGAYLHMLADAAVSLGVVVSGGMMVLTNWLWLDPAVSLAIVFVILLGTWGLLRDSVNLSMDGVPQGINLVEIREYLSSLKNVSKIHDLHVWALSTTETALTVHLEVEVTLMDNVFLQEIQKHLHDIFKIKHATIQVEAQDVQNECMLNRDECK